MLTKKRRGLIINFYKKGISPLIATILLIGFVVVIGGIVIFWGRNFIKEKAEKEGVLAEEQLKCENIDIEIKGIDKITKNIIIENKGNDIIDGFILRVVSGGSGAEKILQKLEPLKIINIGYSFSLSENAKIDLIPSLKPEGTNAPLVPCSNKH